MADCKYAFLNVFGYLCNPILLRVSPGNLKLRLHDFAVVCTKRYAATLHDSAAASEQLHAALHSLLDLLVLILLLVSTSTTMMLGVAAVLALTWITVIVSVSRLAPIVVPAAGRRWHLMHLTTRKVNVNSAFIVFRLIMQAHLT